MKCWRGYRCCSNKCKYRAKYLGVLMDVQQFITEMVEPTLREFEENPTSVRHAFLACVTTFHIIDYLNAKSERQKFQNESPAFKEVDRIAHAFKHVIGRIGQTSPLNASDVISRPPAKWDSAVFDLARWDDENGGVFSRQNRNGDILEAVQQALKFLKGKAALE